jgi:peptidoglycan/LPS O-acetylase OafA/YrhL
MKTALNGLGGLLMVVGAVWALQGLNVIGGSFMTGQTLWLRIGLVCFVAGGVLLAGVNLRRR